MSEKILPVTVVVSNLYKDYFSPFSDWQKHVEPLQINAFGDVLINGHGAGIFLEAVALIEPEIANKRVKSLTLIETNEELASSALDVFNEHYKIPLEISGISYGQLFHSQPDLLFDTIMDFGTVMSYPENSLPYLAKHLKPGGHLYATINSFKVPVNLDHLDIENCTVKVIPDIPTHPDYSACPLYYGLVVEKQK